MTESMGSKTKKIEIAEICRVEGHSAVSVDVEDGKVVDVHLEVFEGTRFFERIVLGHNYDEMPHITSRVCAICSTGHVLAAIRAVERTFEHQISARELLHRELMHLGMIIESHGTHICALALPDFLGTPDLMDFASNHQFEFSIWIKLRKLGANIQTVVGGRPFHPVNMHVGGLSQYPSKTELLDIKKQLAEHEELAQHLCQVVMGLKLPFEHSTESAYLALIPEDGHYGYFGDKVQCSDGWQETIDAYQTYLNETVVPYSHAKQSRILGKPFMVGSMARLAMFGERLGKNALSLYERSPLAKGNKNTVLNNLAQAIELVEAFERAQKVIDELLKSAGDHYSDQRLGKPQVKVKAGAHAGAVECPRGTLYHFYNIDEQGVVRGADMITPSAQNTARIESDIRVVADSLLATEETESLKTKLETLVRAYDPCNTCATHMVEVRYKK